MHATHRAFDSPPIIDLMPPPPNQPERARNPRPSRENAPQGADADGPSNESSASAPEAHATANNRATTTEPAAPHRGSVATTRGVRVTCAPRYERDMSDPAKPQHVFTYRIRIENTSRETVQLRSRHWVILDAHGKREEVHGEGVVGATLTLKPGQHFQYESWCPLASRWGTMEGSYGFVTSEGDPFDVAIARFFLVAED